MGAWVPMQTAEERERFRQLLANSNPIYAATTIDGINRLLDKRRGRAYVYSEIGSDADCVEFQLLLLMTPDRNDPDICKVVNAVPIGNYDPTTAAKIVGRQVRVVLDDLGATSCFGTPLLDYGDEKMNQFFRVMPELFWEMKPEEASTYGKIRFRFKRLSGRWAEDERFEGPALRAT